MQLPVNETLPAPVARLQSLDVLRGAVMLLLVFFDVPNGGWRAPIVAAHPEAPWLDSLLRQFEHVEWAGVALWDMIQPTFMFAVGASLAFSYASRARRGHSFWRMLGHAAYRAAVLILLGVFLRSHAESTNWTFEDVVSQIGLGYVFLFLLWHRGWKVQLAVAAGILAGYWMMFAFWPAPAAGYDYAAVRGHAYYEGFWVHWNKNAHPANYADQWFLNLFPRPEPFVANWGGYNTLNFVPSLATMIFGLMAGELLRSERPAKHKLLLLIAGGCTGVLLGLALHYGGVCPIVKKIWTPSFALLSAGIALLALALLYAIVDVAGWRRWAFPAVVVGMNSIAAYVMIHLIGGWILRSFQRHFGNSWFTLFGEPYRLLMENVTVGACVWLICYWMYRRKLFLRV